jgi:hypothetical protein
MSNDGNPFGDTNASSGATAAGTPASPTVNPYAAPKAAALEAQREMGATRLIPNGRALEAGRGIAWITDSWGYFVKNPGLWIGMVVVMMVIFTVAAFIPILGSLATILLTPVFFAGFMIGTRELDIGEGLRFEHMFDGFKSNIGQLMLVGVIYLVGAIIIGVIMAVLVGGAFLGALLGFSATGAGVKGTGFIVTLLAVLVVALAFIPLLMALWFAPALVVFHELDALSAMKQSFFACLKNIVPFLIYGVVYFVLSIVATLPLLLGWLVLGPMMLASIYIAYKEIFVEQA